MSFDTVRSADSADADDVVATLADAFHDDPVMLWMFAGDTSLLPLLFAAFVADGFAEGEVVTAGDGAAACVWMPRAADYMPRAFTDEEIEGIRVAFGPSAERVATAADLTNARHPMGTAHLYLPFIGVTAAHQGTGLGGTLLRHRLAKADADGVPAYLEASSSRTQPLYERHGFAALGDPIVLPDGPSIQPMWRDPA
jgi:GNAT superfamily N-acetyltransferase